jgi:predicted transcriptional regulator
LIFNHKLLKDIKDSMKEMGLAPHILPKLYGISRRSIAADNSQDLEGKSIMVQQNSS